MNTSLSSTLWPASTAVAAALALSLSLGACGSPAPTVTVAQAPNSITVTSSSEIRAVPDVARITVGITSLGKDAAAAQKANAKPTNAVIDCLKKLGVDERNIQTSYTDLSPHWSEESETPEGYEMRTSLTVDGLAIEQVAEVMSECVRAGATDVNGPEYYLSSYDETYQQALTQAVEASKPKAEVIAQASGSKLGEILTVTEGYQGQSIGYANTQVSKDAGDMEEDLASIEPGELTISAEITVTYAVK